MKTIQTLCATLLFTVSASASAIGNYTYSSPVAKPSEIEARIMSFGVVIVRDPDTNEPTSDTYYTYTVNLVDSDGAVVRSVVQNIPWADIPAARKAELKTLHDLSLTHAENNGIIPAGSAGDDLQ